MTASSLEDALDDPRVGPEPPDGALEFGSFVDHRSSPDRGSERGPRPGCACADGGRAHAEDLGSFVR